MVLLLYLTQIILNYELKLPKDCCVAAKKLENNSVDLNDFVKNKQIIDNEFDEPADASDTMENVNEDLKKSVMPVDLTADSLEYDIPADAVDTDPFADPICGFTATARPYHLVLVPRKKHITLKELC